MVEPSLTFGPVPSMNSTSPSTATFAGATQSYWGGGGLPFPNGLGDNGDGMSATLILGPVFGTSVVVILVIVLTIRWKRRHSWRGVLGLPSRSSIAVDADSSPHPGVWDAYVVRAKETGEDQWRDMKPLSASYAPVTTKSPQDDSSAILTAYSSRTTRSGSDTPRKDSPTILTADRTCPTPRPHRLHVSVLITMPSPPRPPRRNRASYDSSSSSEFEYEKEKSKLHDARVSTADLHLALGVAEISIHDS